MRERWLLARLLACALVASASISLTAAPLLAAPEASAQTADRFADRVLQSAPTRAATENGEAVGTRGPSLARVALSLGGVVVLIVASGWLYRRLFARQQGGGAAIALVSRVLLTPRHQVLLVRAGRRLLVVGDSGQGMNLLCQISDPDEIAQLLGEPAGTTGVSELPVEGAGDEAGIERLPGADSQAFEHPPSLDAACGEIRALIERVRGLGAGQPAETSATETPR